MIRALLPLLLLGCAEDPEPVVGVMRTIVFARADGATSHGFDLDGEATPEDGGPCGVGDYTSPDGAAGVDNAFARMIPALELTEAQAVEGIIQNAINDGDLLLMFEVTGVDDPVEDDEVDFTLLRGAGEPLLGTDRLLETHQTFDRDLDQPHSVVEGTSIVDGRVTAQPIDLRLPIQIFDVALDFQVQQGAIAVDLHEDGTFTGVLAGGIETAAILEVAAEENVDDSIYGILEGLFDANADIDRDGDGICEQVSITFEFTGVPAFFYED